MAAKQVLGNLEGAVILNLSAVHAEPDFNLRKDLLLGELVPQVVARGRVVDPIKVYKAATGYTIINGHRRHGALTLIKAIQAEEVTKEQATAEYGLSATAFTNAQAADIELTLPAIVVAQGTRWSRRINSILSNSGKALAVVDQAREFLDLKSMTLEELVAETGQEIKDGRTLSSRVLNKDIAMLTGYTEAHVSQRLSLVETKISTVAEEVRALTVEAVEAKKINSNEARAILKSDSVETAQAAIKALVEANKLTKAAAKAAAEQARKDEIARLEEEEDKPRPTTTASVNPVVAPGVDESRATVRTDTEALIGILDRQGLTFVRDMAARWASSKKLTVPWTAS